MKTKNLNKYALMLLPWLINPFLSTYVKLHQDQFLESVEVPTKFKGKNMPPKIQVIPALNQARIKGKVWVQFWVKTSDIFNETEPVLSIVFNKNKSTFYRLFFGSTTSNQDNGDIQNFTEKWKSPNGFRNWMRACVLLNFDYSKANKQMDLSISTFQNNSLKSEFKHSYSDASLSEMSFLDIIFGDRHLKNTELNQ
jgi:hypothetical protein